MILSSLWGRGLRHPSSTPGPMVWLTQDILALDLRTLSRQCSRRLLLPGSGSAAADAPCARGSFDPSQAEEG
eukprot:6426005-Pyramimonas_sp.AAC.1